MSNTLIKSFKCRGYTVEIHCDPDASSPRENDNLGKMVCWHRRYDLGDVMPKEDRDTWLGSLLPEGTKDRLERRHERECIAAKGDDARLAVFRDHHERVLAEVRKRHVILPLYLYDHGGLVMRTAPFCDRWDSGQVGYIYTSNADAMTEYSARKITPALRAKVEERLRQEVKTYSLYLEGRFTGYIVKDVDGETVNSCWGFDDETDCEQEAIAAADYEADQRDADHADAAAESGAEIGLEGV